MQIEIKQNDSIVNYYIILLNNFLCNLHRNFLAFFLLNDFLNK